MAHSVKITGGSGQVVPNKRLKEAKGKSVNVRSEDAKFRRLVAKKK